MSCEGGIVLVDIGDSRADGHKVGVYCVAAQAGRLGNLAGVQILAKELENLSKIASEILEGILFFLLVGIQQPLEPFFPLNCVAPTSFYMSESVFFSVLVPTRNRSNLLFKIFQSLNDQFFSDWECVFIENDSDDETHNKIIDFVSENRKFKYVRTIHRGISHARNIGIHHSIGKYIIFLDDDDYLTNNALLLHFENLKGDKDISISDYLYWNVLSSAEEKNKYITPFLNIRYPVDDIINNWEERLSIPIHCVAFKRSLVNKHSLSFDEDLINHEDWVFWAKVFYQARSIVFIDKKLAYYNCNHEYNLTRITSSEIDMKYGFSKAALRIMIYFLKRFEIKFSIMALIRYMKLNSRLQLFFRIVNLSKRIY